jgi:hypothetical protein
MVVINQNSVPVILNNLRYTSKYRDALAQGRPRSEGAGGRRDWQGGQVHTAV